MKELNKEELLMIKGGAISGTYINALVRGVSVILDLGRSLGSAIKRWTEGSFCEL